MAAAANQKTPLHRIKRRLAAFYIQHLLPEYLVLASQSLAGAAFVAGPDATEWQAGL
jgi:hypothetical protein